MDTLRFAWRQLRSAWRAREIRALLAALILAVGGMSAVGFFNGRIEAALQQQGAMLLGADLLLSSDHPLPPGYADAARAAGLRMASALEFPSMVMVGEHGQLAEIKAVSPGYPLRGALAIAPAPFAAADATATLPASGTVWMEARLTQLLDIQVGQEVAVGERRFAVSAILAQEPARGGDLFSIAPRLLMREDEVAATGLIQFGSRIQYRLLLAGETQQVTHFAAWARARAEAGVRIEDVQSARPEMRAALERSHQFLGLAAMAAVLLSVVAMGLSALRYAAEQRDAWALMRCLGARQNQLLRIYMTHAVLIGLMGGALGCGLGLAVQEALARLVGSLFLENLPPPPWQPVATGILAGVAMMLGVMLPQLLRLRAVPALRVLRRDLGDAGGSAWLDGLPATLVVLALLWWSAQDSRLALWVLAGLLALGLAVLALSWLCGRVLRQLQTKVTGVGRLMIANLLKRPALVIAQVAGFSLGFLALALLGGVRADLFHSWQASLPADAPNRFVINIQSDQLPAVRQFFAAQPLAAAPAMFPMVRGRLVAINGRPLDPSHYADARARRLAEREFNLSWAAKMQADNRIVAGRWWGPEDSGKPLLSLEQGIAETLGIHLGDRLTYDIAGETIVLQVQSLRKVEWDSLRANFFAVTPPAVLETFPVSYITSFHLPLGQEALLNRLVRQFPNLTVMDVAALLAQARAIIDRMALALEWVFGLCVLSGVALLYAALAVSAGARAHEAALLRVLGASRNEVRRALLAEYAGMGCFAGLLAAALAWLIAWGVSVHVLHVTPLLSLWPPFLTVAAGLLLVPAAAWWGLRHIANEPPKRILRNV